MRKDTKLYSVLKFLYLNKDRKVSSREISDATKIPIKQITPYTNTMTTYIRKLKIGEWNYFWINSYNLDYIGKLINEIEGEEDEIPME